MKLNKFPSFIEDDISNKVGFKRLINVVDLLRWSKIDETREFFRS